MRASGEKGSPRRRKTGWTLLGLYAVPVAGNLNVVCSVWASLSGLAPGSYVRPMGLALWITAVGLGTAVLGLAAGSLAIGFHRRNPVVVLSGVACILGSFAAWWVGPHFMDWYAGDRGLTFYK
jgi:hypothetical protein